METMFPCQIGIKFFETKNIRGRKKEMTSKKAKVNDLKIKTNFDYRTKEVKKKNNQNTKKIETFFPVSNREDTKK